MKDGYPLPLNNCLSRREECLLLLLLLLLLLQGSVLAGICKGYAVWRDQLLNLFADDDELMRTVKNTDDCRELQGDRDKTDEWSKRWKLDFNTKKCRVMEPD